MKLKRPWAIIECEVIEGTQRRKALTIRQHNGKDFPGQIGLKPTRPAAMTEAHLLAEKMLATS